jgi:hypothetical protein
MQQKQPNPSATPRKKSPPGGSSSLRKKALAALLRTRQASTASSPPPSPASVAAIQAERKRRANLDLIERHQRALAGRRRAQLVDSSVGLL